MSKVVIFNETTKQVLKYINSANTPDYDGRTDVVINPDLSAFSNIPVKYWKVVGGTVLEMTQPEKDLVDLANKNRDDDDERGKINNLNVSVKDIIISLIKIINVRIPNNPITRQEVINQIKQDKGL